MELPYIRPDQLAALSEALDEPGTDLRAILDVLIDDLTSAVPSFLGLALTLHLDGNPVTLSSLDPDLIEAAGASMSLPLDQIPGGLAGTMVFYAYHADAFVDLAADAQRVYGLDGQVVVDGHRDQIGSAGRPPTGPTLAETATVNQAIGVLIDLGYPPEQARAELETRAARAGHPVLQAARKLLDGTARPDES